MPRPTLVEIVKDLAVLKVQIENLEKTLRTEFNSKHDENQKDIKEGKENTKHIEAQLAKVAKSLNRLELKIARYAGGAGVLTAIAIKMIDKFVH